jgi:hypothetical protein
MLSRLIVGGSNKNSPNSEAAKPNESVVEAPADELMARLAFGVESKGNVRTQTLRTFTEDEFRQIVAVISRASGAALINAPPE